MNGERKKKVNHVSGEKNDIFFRMTDFKKKFII